jgi:branched-subunit amino acid transport protein AzlD
MRALIIARWSYLDVLVFCFFSVLVHSGYYGLGALVAVAGALLGHWQVQARASAGVRESQL